MYAIIETGGKQYKVREGDTVEVELLDGEIGDSIELDQVLMLSGDGEMVVGTPTVEDALVRATIAEEVRGDKVVVVKFKPKSRYLRKTGHRQNYTRLQIEEIVAPGIEIEEPEEAVEDVPVEAPAAELAEETAVEVEAEATPEAEQSTEPAAVEVDAEAIPEAEQSTEPAAEKTDEAEEATDQPDVEEADDEA
ncbi:MAG: 50S ribosomal protein L21 [Anaerolineales bacterium]|nr:50S ribosomal protein L21 [Anaerolineales bacterium]